VASEKINKIESVGKAKRPTTYITAGAVDAHGAGFLARHYGYTLTGDFYGGN
jgi:hypothetical protein